MDDVVSIDCLREALVAIADELARNRQHLNDLDSPIGDSDHGDSVCEAFKMVKDAVGKNDGGGEDIGELLTSVGKAITFSGGAAMGPLYGTAFTDAGKSVAGRKNLAFEDLVRMWGAFAEGISRRGGARSGDKTMYDTIRPAVDELEKSFAEGASLSQTAPRIIAAAEKGMNATREMLSLKGRSSRLGQRSRGHIDPGSASMFMVLSVFFKKIAG
jgi:phosphoenolpyruvate---glycerone phosphotransferase subunit DhaL